MKRKSSYTERLCEPGLVEYQEYMKARKSLIAKIKPFIKNGHLPSRNKAPYLLCFAEINKNINCFFHSFFNFSNSELLQLDLDFVESLVLGGKYTWACAQEKDEMECEIEEFLNEAGLEMCECNHNTILKNNQWKVALFLSQTWKSDGRFHFLLEEKDGTWSAKDGFLQSGKTSYYDSLLTKVISNDEAYELHKTFAITNPFVKEK